MNLDQELTKKIKKRDLWKYFLLGAFVLALFVPFKGEILIGRYFQVIINGVFELCRLFWHHLSVWHKVSLLVVFAFVIGVGGGFAKAIEASFSFSRVERIGRWNRIRIMVPVSLFLAFNVWAFYVYFSGQ